MHLSTINKCRTLFATHFGKELRELIYNKGVEIEKKKKIQSSSYAYEDQTLEKQSSIENKGLQQREEDSSEKISNDINMKSHIYHDTFPSGEGNGDKDDSVANCFSQNAEYDDDKANMLKSDQAILDFDFYCTSIDIVDQQQDKGFQNNMQQYDHSKNHMALESDHISSPSSSSCIIDNSETSEQPGNEIENFYNKDVGFNHKLIPGVCEDSEGLRVAVLAGKYYLYKC